jgi:hypothetical protein
MIDPEREALQFPSPWSRRVRVRAKRKQSDSARAELANLLRVRPSENIPAGRAGGTTQSLTVPRPGSEPRDLPASKGRVATAKAYF